MFRAFHQRSYELEHLDKGDYTPEEYEGCLVELRWINEWLGDARALKRSLLAWIKRAGLREFARVARRRIFVIDLHRHPVAYYFYTTIGRLFLHNHLIREDGALSILRSFRPVELQRLAEQAGLKRIEVRRHFPYRLVLIGSKA